MRERPKKSRANLGAKGKWSNRVRDGLDRIEKKRAYIVREEGKKKKKEIEMA